MFAYDIPRPDHFTNLRKEAAESYRGMTAIVSGRPYLVIDREKSEFVLEAENGDKLWMEGGFESLARTEHNALIAASRVNHPFTAGSKLGDWEFGRIAFVEGKWYVRNGATDQVVPIEELTQLLEDNSWDAEKFLANFKIHHDDDPALEDYMPEVKHESSWYHDGLPNSPLDYNLDTMEVTSAPKRNWQEDRFDHTYGPRRDTIGDPRYDRGSYGIGNRELIQEEEAQRQLAPHLWQNPDATGTVRTPIAPGRPGPGYLDNRTVTNPRAWKRNQVADQQMRQIEEEIAQGLRPEKPPFLSEEQWEAFQNKYRGQPLARVMAALRAEADRSDYNHWNEDADHMWWEEEGRHVDEGPGYDEDLFDGDAAAEASEAGYDEAMNGMAPDALTVPYTDPDRVRLFIDGYQQGMTDRGMPGLTEQEIKMLVDPWATGVNPEERAFNAMGASKEAVAEPIIPAGNVPMDIPFDPTVEQQVVHAYEDGDIVDINGQTTFNPEKAYAFLIGQHEFDTAAKVKQLIDRSPPTALPDAVIPPEEAMSPTTELPGVDPAEAPLDPTGGQGAPQGPPAPSSGAPVQPGTEVPPMPGRPAASVKDSVSNPGSLDEMPRSMRGTKICMDCGGFMVPDESGQLVCTNCGVRDEGFRGPYQDIRPDWAKQPRASNDGIEFYTSAKEARKDFSHSEQKALINENLEGRARNYDKLNLKGTHYELEQESSLDDFLWQ